MRYLLDTCIVEALLKEEPGHENIRRRIASAPRGSLAISALTSVEIWTGITGAREPRAKRIAFEAYLKLMRVAAFDADAAGRAFPIQRFLRQTGETLMRAVALMLLASGASLILRAVG